MREAPGWHGTFPIVVAFAFATAAEAATIIPGGNIATQTWTVAGSPYIVQGDARVVPGATLTIAAGVEVRFSSLDQLRAGLDPSRVELQVDDGGALDVNGTAASVTIDRLRARIGADELLRRLVWLGR